MYGTKDPYWAEQVDIQWQVATAWLLHAEGKHQEARARVGFHVILRERQLIE